MTKTVLEQALDHLLNKEEGKAAALLHDYYVSVGRQVYEDIMSDDIAFEEDDADHAVNAVDEVESDLTEEGDDELAPEMGDEEATSDLDAEMGGEEAAPVDADAADVADAMMDVESALAKLKAEFEEMVGGVDADQDGEEGEMAPEMGGEEAAPEETQESIEEALELQKVSLDANTEGSPAGAGTGANSVTGATNTTSPVAKRNPMMARPSTHFGGSPSGEGTASGTTPAKAPKSQDMGGTTKPAVSKVAKPGTVPGREGGSSSSTLPRG